MPTSDADWNRQPVPGEGEAIRNLFSPPIARIQEYEVTEVVTCAYTFTADEKFMEGNFYEQERTGVRCRRRREHFEG